MLSQSLLPRHGSLTSFKGDCSVFTSLMKNLKQCISASVSWRCGSERFVILFSHLLKSRVIGDLLASVSFTLKHRNWLWFSYCTYFIIPWCNFSKRLDHSLSSGSKFSYQCYLINIFQMPMDLFIQDAIMLKCWSTFGQISTDYNFWGSYDLSLSLPFRVSFLP